MEIVTVLVVAPSYQVRVSSLGSRAQQTGTVGLSIGACCRVSKWRLPSSRAGSNSSREPTTTAAAFEKQTKLEGAVFCFSMFQSFSCRSRTGLSGSACVPEPAPKRDEPAKVIAGCRDGFLPGGMHVVHH